MYGCEGQVLVVSVHIYPNKRSPAVTRREERKVSVEEMLMQDYATQKDYRVRDLIKT